MNLWPLAALVFACGMHDSPASLDRIAPGTLVAHVDDDVVVALPPSGTAFAPVSFTPTSSATGFGANGAWVIGCDRYSAVGWVARAPDRARCITSADGAWVVRLTTETGEQQATLHVRARDAIVPLGPTQEVQLWPRSGFVVVLRPSGEIALVDATATLISRPAEPDGPPRAGLLVDPAARWVGFVESGSGLVLVNRLGDDRRVIWPTERGALRWPIPTHDGASIVGVDRDDALVRVDTRSGAVAIVRAPSPGRVVRGPLAVRRDGAVAAALGGDSSTGLARSVWQSMSLDAPIPLPREVSRVRLVWVE